MLFTFDLFKKIFSLFKQKRHNFSRHDKKVKMYSERCSISKALVEWPFGTYTLVKPNAGCPSGWLEGWRYQDYEDHNNKNKMSYGQHFYGEYTRHKKAFSSILFLHNPSDKKTENLHSKNIVFSQYKFIGYIFMVVDR